MIESNGREMLSQDTYLAGDWAYKISEDPAEVVLLGEDNLLHILAADAHIGSLAELGSSTHLASSHNLGKT